MRDRHDTVFVKDMLFKDNVFAVDRKLYQGQYTLRKREFIFTAICVTKLIVHNMFPVVDTVLISLWVDCQAFKQGVADSVTFLAENMALFQVWMFAMNWHVLVMALANMIMITKLIKLNQRKTVSIRVSILVFYLLPVRKEDRKPTGMSLHCHNEHRF